jgi:hypothetical protein
VKKPKLAAVWFAAPGDSRSKMRSCERWIAWYSAFCSAVRRSLQLDCSESAGCSQ